MLWKSVLGLLVVFTTFLAFDAPQAEARFGNRYASASGWRPGKLLIRVRHANADRRQARRAEGRGLLPGYVARHRSAGCGTSSQTTSGCPSCPSVPSAPSNCPGGVCPNPN